MPSKPADPNLHLIFSADTEEGRRDAVGRAPEVIDLKERISKQASGRAWSVAVAQLASAVNDLLDVSLVEIMFGAFSRYSEIQENLAESKKAADVQVMPLLEHTISTVHKPHVDVLVNDVSLGKIEFRIEAALDLKGAILTMKDGRITEIRTGECLGRGSIQCGGIELVKQDYHLVKLPEVISFEDR